VVKNKVHAAGNQTFFPIPATFKLRCYQQVLALGSELDCCQLGRPYSIHIYKVPPSGASDDHLWKNYACSKTLPASIKEKETHWPEVR